MASAKDGLLFNYGEFKRQFREAAQRRGIDPAEGSNKEQAAAVRLELTMARHMNKPSSFQCVAINAESRRDLHHSRMRQSVRDAAARQLEQAKRGVRWEAGHGLLTDDYQAIDEMLVAKAESTEWWGEMNRDDWKPGAGSSFVERQSMTPIRRHARNEKAARFKTAGEVMHEVLEENPTQADMKAKRLQKEAV